MTLMKLAKQLDHTNPQQRRQAIEALAKQDDQRALSLLEAVSKRDPDETVRRFAEKAIAYFKRRTGIEAAPELPDKTQSRKSKIDPKLAEQCRRLVNEAMASHTRGDNLKAARALRKVLLMNPGLKNDTYVASLVGSVTDLDGDEAFEALLSARRLETIPGVAATLK